MTPATAEAGTPTRRWRRSRHGRVAWAAVGAWATTAVCTAVAPRWSAVVVAVAAVVILLTRGGPRGLAALALGVLLGAATSGVHVRALHSGIVPAMAHRHAAVEVVARVVRDPVTVASVGGGSLMLTDATVLRVWSGRWQPAHSPVLVLSRGPGWEGLLPGQRIDVSGRLSPPRSGDDVAAVLGARAAPGLIGRPPWWQRAAGRIRSALRTSCAGLPRPERGLLPGLVDGDVSGVPPSQQADMRTTGLTHLEAVSGENVSVVLAVTAAVARGVGLRRRSRVALCTVSLLGFVILARPSPSVLRAAVMGAVVLLAMITGRRSAALPALSAAVLLLVTVNPFLARSVGFVLSVLATAALVTIAPVWTRWLTRFLPRALATAIAVPAAAQIACTPVLILAFGQLTPYAVPANLLAAPAVPPATVLGVVCAMLSTVVPRAGPLVAWLAAAPTAVIATVAAVLARLPGAGARFPSGTDGLLVATLLAAGFLVAIGACRLRAMLGAWPP